jgi:hypothetical protein
MRGELPDRVDVTTSGSLGIITALEFVEHPFSKLGHRLLLVTHTNRFMQTTASFPYA